MYEDSSGLSSVFAAHLQGHARGRIALYLTDVPNNVERTPVTVPYAFGAVIDGNNIESWTVYVNGVLNRRLSVPIVDGGLKISRGRLVIILR